MGKKLIIICIMAVVLIGGAGVGYYFYYDSVLRFSDDHTVCPVKAFRVAATSPKGAMEFVTTESMGSLTITGQCGLACDHDNTMACALYGIALQKGVHVMKSLKDAKKAFKRGCDKRESLACQLDSQASEYDEAQKRAKAEAKAKEANRDVLREIAKAKSQAAQRMQRALAHFNGRKGPMISPSMLEWHADNVQYLLYDKPYLATKHKVPGFQVKKGQGLKALVVSKYTGGEKKPDFELIKKFLDTFKRYGINQIRLDYRVEKKKETDIPKKHGYFRAKHTFLYHVAEAELEIFELLESTLS
jgi:hypothetical protein